MRVRVEAHARTHSPVQRAYSQQLMWMYAIVTFVCGGALARFRIPTNPHLYALCMRVKRIYSNERYSVTLCRKCFHVEAVTVGYMDFDVYATRAFEYTSWVNVWMSVERKASLTHTTIGTYILSAHCACWYQVLVHAQSSTLNAKPLRISS